MKKPAKRKTYAHTTPPNSRMTTPGAASSKAKKITIDIPKSLLEAAAQIVSERQVTTSALVREAMEYFVEQKQARKLEQELEEGYLATANLSKRVHREFEHVDAEN
jgi:CopG family transcriptional regulator / antitoxin EndoAI